MDIVDCFDIETIGTIANCLSCFLGNCFYVCHTLKLFFFLLYTTGLFHILVLVLSLQLTVFLFDGRFGGTPFRKGLESPSAWKSPWFFNTFLCSPRLGTEITVEVLKLLQFFFMTSFLICRLDF